MKDYGLEERRQKILDMLAVKGKVKVSELSRIFGISEVSIRNDLAELEQKGALERTHGGAVGSARAYYDMSFNERIGINADEKRRIAVEASRHIKDGDSVFLNPGSTTLLAAREMKNRKNLKVVTNSLPIASEMGFFNNTQVILLGGNYNPQFFFCYGDETLLQLRKYHGDRLILSVDGVSPTDGITTYLHQEAEVVKQMIERVNTTIVVADHTKIGRTSFASITPLDHADILITGAEADEEILEQIRESGIEVLII